MFDAISILLAMFGLSIHSPFPGDSCEISYRADVGRVIFLTLAIVKRAGHIRRKLLFERIIAKLGGGFRGHPLYVQARAKSILTEHQSGSF